MYSLDASIPFLQLLAQIGIGTLALFLLWRFNEQSRADRHDAFRHNSELVGVITQSSKQAGENTVTLQAIARALGGQSASLADLTTLKPQIDALPSVAADMFIKRQQPIVDVALLKLNSTQQSIMSNSERLAGGIVEEVKVIGETLTKRIDPALFKLIDDVSALAGQLGEVKVIAKNAALTLDGLKNQADASQEELTSAQSRLENIEKLAGSVQGTVSQIAVEITKLIAPPPVNGGKVSEAETPRQ